MILQFAAAGTSFSEGFISGTRQSVALSFYPGAFPQRAVVRARSGPISRVQRLHGYETLGAFLDHTSEATARQPWLERPPAALEEVVPLVADGRWMVSDREGAALPLTGGEHWTLLALSGGRPVDLASEWDGEGLLPLGAVAGGTYYILGGDG